MSTPLMPAAWSYARTSTTKQAAADRSGIQRQEQALAQWLAAHPTYQLQEALVDPGLSGSGAHRQRGALGKFIAAAKAGNVPPGSVLIVESITRFSREAERKVMGTLLNDFWGNDLGLAICGHDEIYTAELIDSQPHRLHVLLALMQQARAEWLEKSRRSKGARAAARAKQDAGIRTPGRAPFWIKRDASNRLLRDSNGLLQLNEHAETVRRMVDLHLSGLGGDLIARQLNAEGLPTGTKAKEWIGESVRKVLRSPQITGTLVRAAGNVENYFPAAISPATFAQVQQASAQRELGKGGVKGASPHALNLFMGISRCAHCGGPISCFKAGSASAGTRSYVSCRNAVKAKTCPHRAYVPMTSWEPMGLALLTNAQWAALLLRPEDQAELHQLRQQVDQHASAHHTLNAELQRNEERAEQAWASGASEERQATIERLLKKQRTELEHLQQNLDTARQHLALAEARPSAVDQAELIQQRLAELLPQLESGDARVAFNRFLRQLNPKVKLLLHPSQRIELVVGDHHNDIQPIDEGLARIALDQGGGGLQINADGSATIG